MYKKKGSCQVKKSQQVSACRFLRPVKLNCLLIFFPHRSQPTTFPNVLLIKPSIAAKRERGETWEEICYGFQQDDYGRQINSKHGNLWSPLNGFWFMFERAALSSLTSTLNIYNEALFNIDGKLHSTSRHYRLYYNLN